MSRKGTLQPDNSTVVYITPSAFTKMQAYVRCAPGEISGLGEVEFCGIKDFVITDVFIFRQNTSSGHTSLDPDALAEFLSEAVDQGRDLDRIHLWWHSHADAGVFWSSTDEETTSVFVNAGWMVSIVGNRAGKYLTRIDYYNPRMSADRLRLIPSSGQTMCPTDEEIRAEILEKVLYLKPVIQKPVIQPIGDFHEQRASSS